MPNNNRDVEKEKTWREIIERQKKSGKSPSRFCKDEGFTEHRFYYWRSVLSKRQKEKRPAQQIKDTTTIPFVPLTLPDNHDFNIRNNSTEQIEISKIVFRISANSDKSTLACILQSLEKA